MASVYLGAGCGRPEVSIHACDTGDADIQVERVKAHHEYGSVTMAVGGIEVTRYVRAADQLRAEAAALNRAALELDRAMHALTPPAVVAAGDAACEAVASVEEAAAVG